MKAAQTDGWLLTGEIAARKNWILSQPVIRKECELSQRLTTSDSLFFLRLPDKWYDDARSARSKTLLCDVQIKS
jgi:hypothetical protein